MDGEEKVGRGEMVGGGRKSLGKRESERESNRRRASLIGVTW